MRRPKLLILELFFRYVVVWSRVGIVYNDYQQHADASVHAVMMIVIKNGGDLADLLKAESERSKFKCFFIYYCEECPNRIRNCRKILLQSRL